MNTKAWADDPQELRSVGAVLRGETVVCMKTAMTLWRQKGHLQNL